MRLLQKNQKLNITESIMLDLKNTAAQFASIERIVLFGSRARGDHAERSDIDLAVFVNHPFEDFFEFQYQVENSVHTLLKFDIVLIEPGIDQGLFDEINKDGVIIYEKS